MLTQVLRLGQGLLQRTAAVLETGIAAAAADIAALDADAVADGIIAAVRGEGVVALGIHRLAGRTGRPVGTEVESSLRAIGGLGYLEGRSEERRVGKGGVRTCRSRWAPAP